MNPLPSPFQETINARTAFVKTVSVTASRGVEQAVFEAAGGSLTQDARRTLRWNGSLTIPVETEFLPTVPEDLLTPFGTTIEVKLGVMLASGVIAEVGFGVYDLDDSQVSITANSQQVALSLVDLGERVARYRFESPFETPAGTDLADTVELVVGNRLGITLGLPPTGVTLLRSRVFGLDPNLDPAREIVDLVAGFGYRIWFDRNGDLQLDQPPTPDPSTALFLEGSLTVNGAWANRPPNVIVVRGETSDETPPIQSVAMDNDSDSPTYAGVTAGSSPYGRVTRFFASPLITSQGAADLASRNMLAASAAQGATWEVTKAYDPTIDPDDVLTVPIDEDTNLPLVVDSVDLDLTGVTTFRCRAISQLSE